jgi:hypothetical protein
MQAAFKSDADMMAGADTACEIGIAANQSAVTMSSSFEHCIGVLLSVALSSGAPVTRLFGYHYVQKAHEPVTTAIEPDTILAIRVIYNQE